MLLRREFPPDPLSFNRLEPLNGFVKGGTDAMGLLWFLIIGALAGFLAGKLMTGGGFGLLGNLLVGIVGAMIGGFLFGALGVSVGGGLVGSLLTATVGAVVLLYLAGLLKK
jgi:uncharacterized membrane protein YeaQ/YmgE (transglycosylase-associated protein family)